MLLPRYLASAIALLASSALAQVTTDCQPLNKTCPADPALGMDYSWAFNSTPKAWAWETTVGTVDFDNDNGAAFTISKQGDSPTLRSKFYFFWGRTEIWMKAAQGRGIVSSVMFLSDDLDEIDWEFVGGEPNNVQTNFYGKGVIESSIPGKHDVPGNAQEDFHNYTTIWTQDYLDFYIDGNKVRTLLPAQANKANDTQYYPQTPMRLSFGIWAGGDPRMPDGTKEWAGGQTDYNAGPYTMHVKSVRVTDYSDGEEYVYGDRSGDWESIKIVEGNSTIKEIITAPPKQSVSDKWNGMSSTTKTIIYACCAGAGALLVMAAVYVCIRQRRRGARQAALAEAQYERDRVELERLQKAGIDPDSFTEQAAEYHAGDMKKDGMATTTTYSVPPSPPLDGPNNTPSNGQFEPISAVGAGAAAGAALGATGAAAASLSQSPRVASPAPAPGQQQQQFNSFDNNMNMNRVASPAPAPGQQQQQFNSFDNNMNMNRVASPAPAPGQQQQQFNSFDNNMNMNRVASPAPSIPSFAASAMTPTIPNVTGGYQNQSQSPSFPPNRSFTSPVPVSPNPQGSMYGDMNRVGSPAPGVGLAHPQPQRSFTAGPTAPGFASPQSASFDFHNNGGYSSPQASTFGGAYGQQAPGLGTQSGGAGYGQAAVGQVPDFGLPGQNGFAEGRDSYWGDTRDDGHNQGHMNNGGYR